MKFSVLIRSQPEHLDFIREKTCLLNPIIGEKLWIELGANGGSKAKCTFLIWFHISSRHKFGSEILWATNGVANNIVAPACKPFVNCQHLSLIIADLPAPKVPANPISEICITQGRAAKISFLAPLV